MTRKYALSDAHWKHIKDLLPGQAGQPGATARDNRLFVDTVLYRYRADIL
jgi:transposase